MTRSLALGVAGALLTGLVLWQLPGALSSSPPPGSGSRPARSAVLPELPRVTLDTTYTPPTGPTITVPAGGDFQAALNAAPLNSVIVLQAGATYSGNFTLPNKTGTGWIYIQSSALSSLPAPGTRISPAQAGLMPKIVSSNTNPALQAASAAHHYRLVGIEITTTWTTRSATLYALINLDSPGGSTSLSQVPSYIVIDRCYIHGTSTGNIRNGVVIDSAYTAVIDSSIAEIHEVNGESHGIRGKNGPGPFKIVNNTIEAAGINLMFTNHDARVIQNLVPSDIEVRGNYLSKSLTWLPGTPAFAGIYWAVKNNLELKNAARVLIDGNLFENTWVGVFEPQDGFCIAFTVRAVHAPWSVVEDVTFTHNIVRQCSAGIQFLGRDYNNRGQGGEQQRLLVQNNLFSDIGAYPMIRNAGQLFLIVDGGIDYIIDHNTAFHIEDPIYAQVHDPTAWPARGFTFTNNIVVNNAGVCGDDTGCNAMLTLRTYFPNAVFERNIIIGGTARNYPPRNFFPASLDAVGFVNRQQGKYRLAASSRYKRAGTEGSDPGVDFDALPAVLGR